MKKLKKILLINWLYFSKEIIEVGDVNFLTGKNGAGKSTVIDALQIVLLGETNARNFNQAANEKSQRTLDGYLRADMDENNPYSRRGKDFSSYIACEFQDDVAGITASWKFNPNVSVTGAWMRLYNDNWSGNDASPANYLDNFDLFVLSVPVTFEGLKITPWGMAGAMSPNTLLKSNMIGDAAGGSKTFTLANHNTQQGIDGLQLRDGLYPAAFSSRRPQSTLWSSEYSTMGWGGLTGQWSMLDPFRLSWDFVYGSVDHGRKYLNRQGWYGMLVAEYATDWGLPGLYGWYFSGDDANPDNGSERMPYLSTTNNLTNSLSTFGYRGNPIIGGGKGILGTNPTGTWGVGARVKDIPSLENLTHTLRVNYFGGTNNTKMASYITGRQGRDNDGRQIYRNNTDFNSFGTYLTTADTGLEVNLDSKFKATENLTFVGELGYIHLWLDKDVWGQYQNIAGTSLNMKDAWKASVNVIYAF